MATINFPRFVSLTPRPSACGKLPRGGLLTPWKSAACAIACLTAGAAQAAPPTKPAAAPAAAPAPAAPALSTTPSTPPVPPAGDLWRRPKAPTAWSITYKYNTPLTKAQEAARVSGISVTAIGQDSLQTVQIANRSLELWKTAGQAFLSEASVNDVSVRIAENQVQANDVSVQLTTTTNPIGLSPEQIDWASLDEFSWIKPECFKGTIPLGGQMMLIYAEFPPEPELLGKARIAAPKWPPGPLGGMPLQPGIRVAAVDESTRLPKYLQQGADISIYTFRTPEQAKLEIPPKIKNLVEVPKPTGPIRKIDLTP